ncbi:MAG: sterol desaturase family protein [Deltaproteobacteria bacterium]|nr:sterol desaturase family protein [Deltaproteobacteria bacterium]
MSVVLVLALTLAASGVLMLLLHFAYASGSGTFARIKLYADKPKRLSWDHSARNIATNMALTGGLSTLYTLRFRDYLIDVAPASALTSAGQALAAILLYDLLYYLMHRYLLHEWKLLRSVHVVHHQNKHPTALESLYGHPFEFFMGVTLLMLCTAIVGPVSLPAFAVIFGVFSFLNLLIHSGLDFGGPVGYMIRKHVRHHAGMKAGNYGSITPLPDLLFGTLED